MSILTAEERQQIRERLVEHFNATPDEKPAIERQLIKADLPALLAEVERLEKFNETQMRYLLPDFFKERDRLQAQVERLEKERDEAMRRAYTEIGLQELAVVLGLPDET